MNWNALATQILSQGYIWFTADLELSPKCLIFQARKTGLLLPLVQQNRDHQLAGRGCSTQEHHREGRLAYPETSISPSWIITNTAASAAPFSAPTYTCMLTYTLWLTYLHAHLSSYRLSELIELVLRAGTCQHLGKFWNPEAITILQAEYFWRWAGIHETKRCSWGSNVFLLQILFHFCKYCKTQ